MELSKLWMSGAGLLVGAIGGAYINAQRVAGAVQKTAEASGEDALLETARTVGTGSLAAGITGAVWGAIIGLIAVGAYLYFTNPDREMRVRKYRTGDDF